MLLNHLGQLAENEFDAGLARGNAGEDENIVQAEGAPNLVGVEGVGLVLLVGGDDEWQWWMP